MGFLIIFFAFPLTNLPYLILVSLTTACVFLIIKKLLKIKLIVENEEDEKSENGGLVLKVSFFSALMHGIIAIALWVISWALSPYFFECVFSEWGLEHTGHYFSASVYFLLWNALSSFFLYFICTKLKFTFNDPAKAKKLFALTSITVGIIF